MILLPLLAASLMSAPVAAPEPSPLEPFFFAPYEDSHTHSGYYLRVSGGLTSLQDSDGPSEDVEFDDGYLLSAGIGSRVGAWENGLGFSVELEGFYTNQDTNDNTSFDDVATTGALVDGIFDFRVADRFSVYAGAGIGVGWVDVGEKNNSLSDFDSDDGPNLAWQLKAGVTWRFAQSTSLLVGYRFVNIDDTEIHDNIGSSSFDLQTEQHVLELGIVFGF